MRKRIIFLTVLIFICVTAFTQDNNNHVNTNIESFKQNMGYAKSLSIKANFYFSSGDYTKSIEIDNERLKILEAVVGENNMDYAITLAELALFSYYNKNIDNAISYAKRALQKIEILEGKKSKWYLLTTKKLSQYYLSIKDFETAEYYQAEVDSIPIEADQIIETDNNCNIYSDFSITQEIMGYDEYPNSEKYRDKVVWLSTQYIASGEYEKAYTLVKKLFSYITPSDSIAYFQYLPYLANCCHHMGYNDYAVNLWEEILSYVKNVNKVKDLQYANILENLAISYLGCRRIRDALFVQEESLDIKKTLFGEKSTAYASALAYTGHLYYLVGDREKSISILEKASMIMNDLTGSNNYLYTEILRYLSHVYKHTSKEVELLEKACYILRNIGENIAYIDCLCSLAEAYAENGDSIKAREALYAVIDNSHAQRYFKANLPQYVKFLNRAATVHLYAKEYEKAKELGIKASEICKQIYGKTKQYSETAYILISCYSYLKDTTNLTNIIKESNIIEDIKDEVINNMRLLSNNYRKSYWTWLSPILINFIPAMAYVTKDDRLISQAYDISALITKGVLLKMDTELSDLIKIHGDSILQEDYKWYMLNTKKLDDVKSSYERDSIINVLARQEDKIRQELSKKGLFNNFNASWTDIRDKLDNDDIAIEFITCKPDSVNQLNAALLLKKDYIYPKFVTLADASHIKEFFLKDQSDSLYSNIWEPFKEELRGVKNIYFSPAGEFHNIPIEYLQNYDGQYMHELYNIYRLSSTQEILKTTKIQRSNNAVLYGGLNYDSNLALIAKNDNPNGSLSSIDRGLRDSLSNRSGFEALPNTMIEISEINSILKQSKMESVVFTGDDGNEESFKKLSGRPIDIIHMSTHGMYVKEIGNSSRYSIYSRLLNRDEEQEIGLINRPLLRSFLVMAGGNLLPRHKYVPNNSEDGILTAQEISRLDLYGVDLVVLSACQTGLGDVDSEGVWGLQRGFKKAGVNTILMSLDKVDDEATRILMVEFYRNLTSGKTKHQSLKDAQKHLREVENGKYDDPKYWASFIMLDGLN